MTDLTVNTEPIDLDAVKAAIEQAHTEVGQIASQGAHRRWRMSIPARADRDSDLIISRALDYAETLHGEAKQRRRDLADACRLLETALAIFENGEDPRANRTVRRLQHEARTFLAALNKPGEETP